MINWADIATTAILVLGVGWFAARYLGSPFEEAERRERNGVRSLDKWDR